MARAGWAPPAVLAAEAAWALADLALHEEAGCPARLPAPARPPSRLWAVVVGGGQDPDGRGRGGGGRALRRRPRVRSHPRPPAGSPGMGASRRSPRGRGRGGQRRHRRRPGGRHRPQRHGGRRRRPRPPRSGPGRRGSRLGRSGGGTDPAAQALGRARPPSLAAQRRISAPGAVIGLEGIDRVAGPDGVQAVTVALAGTDCPEPGALLARW